MAIISEFSPPILTIRVLGGFDFNVASEFGKAFEEHGDLPEQYVIDMMDVESLDSSGLGLMLLLRNFVGVDKPLVQLRNISPKVRKVLLIAHFDRIFDVK